MSWSPPPSPGPREAAGGVILAQTSTPLPREHGVSKRQHPVLQVALPATPSALVLAQGEISFTPPPRSPAAASAGELSPRTTPHHAPDGTSSDKSSETALGGRLSRKESYKAQRQHYRKEKKRAASALLSSIEDPSVVVLADWLKVRGSLKSWTKLWCVLKPGLLLLYKSSKAKSSHWVGTVLLSACEVIERPSKKDGFCFKLYHPLEQSIWAPRGPHNEAIGAVVQPLPTAHLIFRAPSQAAGHCWLDGLELALRCTNSMLRCRPSGGEKMTEVGGPVSVVRSVGNSQAHASHTTQWSPEDLERHFNDNAKLDTSRPLLSVEDYFEDEIEPHSPEAASGDRNFLDVNFGFFSKNLLRNSPCTGSMKLVAAPKITLSDAKSHSKSTASTPSRLKSEKVTFSQNLLEDNFLRVVGAFPKRCSSTPSILCLKTPSDSVAVGVGNSGSIKDGMAPEPEIPETLSGNARTLDGSLQRPKSELRITFDGNGTPDFLETQPANEDCERSSTDSSSSERRSRLKYSLIGAVCRPSEVWGEMRSRSRLERQEREGHYVSGTLISELEGEEQSEPEWDMDQRTASVLARLRQIYEEEPSDHVGMSGELVEEMAEENKNLLWFLIKQVRPGMDLSKVVLPTFILEPRSFLDKLSDNYYHADILASAVETEDPYLRFKTVLRWYLSGLYRKPKGLKKPYNPVLGEMFRCFWLHPSSGSRTYYIAEQVSHHPPVSAFYISNRKEGFVIEGSLLAKSKFHGNATSAILEGYGRVHIPARGEVYCTTAPYAYCRGLVLGTLSMELGGKVTVACAQTGFRADVEFKLKGFLGGAEQTNVVSGRIRKGKETLAHIDGYWDGRIDIKDKQTGEEGVFLDVAVLKMQRLKRYLVNMDEQQDFESQKLWAKVSVAIANDDQIAATEQKTVVEEMQREKAKSGVIWVPRQFHPVDIQAWSCNMATEGQAWQYNHANTESWSEHECLEYEENFVIQSVMRDAVARRSLTSFTDGTPGQPAASRRSEQAATRRERESDRSDSESGAEMQTEHQRRRHYKDISSHNLKKTLAAIETALREQTRAIESLRRAVVSVPAPRYQTHHASAGIAGINANLLAGVIVAFVVQMTLRYFFY